MVNAVLGFYCSYSIQSPWLGFAFIFIGLFLMSGPDTGLASVLFLLTGLAQASTSIYMKNVEKRVIRDKNFYPVEAILIVMAAIVGGLIGFVFRWIWETIKIAVREIKF